MIRIATFVMVLSVAAGAFGQATQPAPVRAPNAPGPEIVVPQPIAPPVAPVPALGTGRGQVTLSWDEFVKITGYDPAKKGGQTLTIPWTEVEKLLGAELQVKPGLDKTTVDLPWNDFRALLQWSLDRKKKDEAPPPADYVVASSQYAGELSADAAKFTLTVKLDILRKTGWKRIPVLSSAVALTKTTLPKNVFLNSAGDHYELLTEESGQQEVTLEFSAAVTKSAGISRASVPRVLAGSSVIDLKVEPADVEVKVVAAQSLVAKPADGKMNVQAALGGNAPLDITWERALPKVAAAPTKLYSETRTLLAVAEGVLLGQEMVSFNILYSPVRELKLTAPAGVSVLEVAGPNVQDWRAANDGAITVMLRAEALGPYNLRLAFEKTAAEAVEAPVIRAAGVEREKGFIGVVALANVEIAAGEVAGATVIDVRQLPPDIVAMTNQPILLGFRYVTDKFAIPLAIKKHEQVSVLVTVADSALLTAMQLDDGRRITKAVYGVRNNRNQFLRVKMPESAEIWSASVDGAPAAPAKDAGNVLIPLVRSAAARELASFPVEIVYVETPKAVAPERGKLRVELPALDCPTMHVMYSFYAPAEGKYTVGWGASGFSGPLRLVENFAALATGAPAEALNKAADVQAAQLQQTVDARADAQAKAAGVQPIRVQLPVNGKLFKLERILVLQKEQLWFQVEYSGWKPAK